MALLRARNPEPTVGVICRGFLVLLVGGSLTICHTCFQESEFKRFVLRVIAEQLPRRWSFHNVKTACFNIKENDETTPFWVEFSLFFPKPKTKKNLLKTIENVVVWSRNILETGSLYNLRLPLLRISPTYMQITQLPAWMSGWSVSSQRM